MILFTCAFFCTFFGSHVVHPQCCSKKNNHHNHKILKFKVWCILIVDFLWFVVLMIVFNWCGFNVLHSCNLFLILEVGFCSFFFWYCSTLSANNLTKVEFLMLCSKDLAAKVLFVVSDVSTDPSVGVESSMNDNNPFKMLATLHKGFHDSG